MLEELNKIEELLNEIISKSIEVNNLLDEVKNFYKTNPNKDITEKEFDYVNKITMLRYDIMEMME